MVKPKRHKGEGRPPDAHNLGHVVPSAGAEEARQTHEPIGANGTQEDLVPLRRDLLRDGEGLGFGPVATGVEDSSV